MRKSFPIHLVVTSLLITSVIFLIGCGKRGGLGSSAEQVNPTATPLPGKLLLFFVAEDGSLRREDREVPEMPTAQLSRIRLVVDELLAGSRQGLASPFPFATSVVSVFLDRSGNAYVDFSPPPPGFSTGTDSEIALVYATINSVVANCPTVKRVQLLFGGRENLTLGHLDLSSPLRSQVELVSP